MFSVFIRSTVLRKVVCRVIQEPLKLNSVILTMGGSYSKSYSPNDKWKSSGITCTSSMAPTPTKETDDDAVISKVLCHQDDLQENEMKEYEIGEDKKVLLAKQHGKIHAIGTKCTHYGAPLVKGALGEGRVRCPWHGACFNLNTGDIEDFPGFDSLPCYQVTITQKGQVRVSGRVGDFKNNVRVRDMITGMPCTTSDCKGNEVVIIGGGYSGATCAETLRMEGFQGSITVIAKETHLPYDRIKVSKMSSVTDIAKIQPRTQKYYEDAKIEYVTGVEATKVDTEAKLVHLSNNETRHYSSLYIATGSKPRLPEIPGLTPNIKNVFTVRNYEDNVNILNSLDPNKNVVILGLGFIGMEMAAVCADKAKSVKIVGHHPTPLGNVFGDEIGGRLQTLMEEKGVQFYTGNTIVKVNSENDTVISVELNEKVVLMTDILILGTGTTYNTEFLANDQIKLQKDGAIDVNEFLETNVPNVFAGGDIAYAPVFISNNKMNIGHIGLAQSHGRIAALNILNRREKLRTVPFFWTMLFGKSIRYAGCGTPVGSRLVGNLEEFKFVVFFFDKADNVISVASCNHDPIVAQYAELLQSGKTLTKKHLKDDPLAWATHVQSLASGTTSKPALK